MLYKRSIKVEQRLDTSSRLICDGRFSTPKLLECFGDSLGLPILASLAMVVPMEESLLKFDGTLTDDDSSVHKLSAQLGRIDKHVR
jgi:hypothetical protein